MGMISKNLDLLESMIYYWKATSEKEKVGELFISSIFENEYMKYAFSDDFTKESIQKVLSAISNREMFKPSSQKEGRFWNNNMWMLEDLGVTDAMLAPVKTMNMDELSKEYPELSCEVVFLPGHVDTYYVDKEKKRLVINFFRLFADFVTGDIKIEDMELSEFVRLKLKELA